METNRNQNIFFLTLLLLVLALNFFIFLGYLTPIVIAITLAVMARPVYVRLLRRLKKPTFAALFTTIFVLIVFMIPLSFLAGGFFWKPRVCMKVWLMEPAQFLTGLTP